MGEVYLAQDIRLDRKVAIKFLPPESVADERAKKRLLREAQAAAKLDHPNICAIHEVAEGNDRDFIVMQYVEGETLASRLHRTAFELPEALEFAIQVADALSEAHSRGVIHRDIKPANIMMTTRGQAKVMDFGLAKLITENKEGLSEATTEVFLTEPNVIIGTLPYMSPEQVQGETLDARSDIFSFGAVLYEMVGGRNPFAAKSAAATLSAILSTDPPPLARYAPDVPAELGRITRKCLEKNRERRYQTMRDVLVDLENLRSSTTAANPATTATVSDTRTLSGIRNQLPKAIVVVVVLAVLISVGVFISRSRGPNTDGPNFQISSIAVLPLRNLSGDAAQEYFADGMTEALINELARIGALRVISRQSVMQYKGATKTMPEIARELNVDAVVDGSVLRSNDRVRITAQLIRAASDEHLWAKSYEREMRDVLALQGDIARGISDEIKIKLTPREVVLLTKTREVDPAAHDAYLNGLYWLNQAIDELRTEEMERLHKKSFEYFEQAIELDPNYAPAHAALSNSYMFLATSGFPQFYSTAKEWALKAIAIDDSLAEAHRELAYSIWRIDWNLQRLKWSLREQKN
jgi:serine/threonine protein kinase